MTAPMLLLMAVMRSMNKVRASGPDRGEPRGCYSWMVVIIGIFGVRWVLCGALWGTLLADGDSDF